MKYELTCLIPSQSPATRHISEQIDAPSDEEAVTLAFKIISEYEAHLGANCQAIKATLTVTRLLWVNPKALP